MPGREIADRGVPRVSWLAHAVTALSILGAPGCGPTIKTTEREMTPGGNLTYSRERVGDSTTQELRRVFQSTVVEGFGIFEDANEGLARRMATQLARADVAATIQSRVKSDSVIYNNAQVRDVVETQVNALVMNCTVESAGYDPGTNKYRVKVSIRGEQLVREIETRILR